MISFKIPKFAQKIEIKKFFIKKHLHDLLNASNEKENKSDKMERFKPWAPKLEQLYFVYKVVTLNKRLTILEFGSGWSSLVFISALNELKKKYQTKIKLLRKSNPFNLFAVDNEKKYLSVSKKRAINFMKKKNFISKCNFLYSDVIMTKYNNHIVTEYKKLPLCNPDLIFLDGPGQFKVKGRINNITTTHKDVMPMSCDILKIEFFLVPGTIILADGRGANCEFLRPNFKRKWKYKYFKKIDLHLFCLIDRKIGKYNSELIKFYGIK